MSEDKKVSIKDIRKIVAWAHWKTNQCIYGINPESGRPTAWAIVDRFNFMLISQLDLMEDSSVLPDITGSNDKMVPLRIRDAQ